MADVDCRFCSVGRWGSDINLSLCGIAWRNICQVCFMARRSKHQRCCVVALCSCHVALLPPLLRLGVPAGCHVPHVETWTSRCACVAALCSGWVRTHAEQECAFLWSRHCCGPHAQLCAALLHWLSGWFGDFSCSRLFFASADNQQTSFAVEDASEPRLATACRAMLSMATAT